MFPNESVSWIKEYSSENIETECVEVKYKVENDEISILEANKVVLTVSPREINQVIAQKDNAIVEMSAQIQSLNTKIEKLQPYKDKVEQIEKAEKEAKMAKDIECDKFASVDEFLKEYAYVRFLKEEKKPGPTCNPTE